MLDGCEPEERIGSVVELTSMALRRADCSQAWPSARAWLMDGLVYW